MKNIKANLLYAVCQNIPDAICIVDTDWNIRSWNIAARTLFAYDEDEIIGKNIRVILPEEIAQEEMDHCIRELNTKGIMTAYETVRRTNDGRIVPIELTAVALKENDAVTHFAAIKRGTAERKRIERELAKIGRRNELILESAGEGIFGMDSRGDHIFVNNAGRKILGYGADELINRHSHPIWHHSRPDGAPYSEEECGIYKTARDGISRHVDNEVFWKKDGAAVPVEYTTTPIREGAGIVGTVVTFRDITVRRQAERRLRESEEKYRSIVETSADWIWEADLEGILTFNNPAVERILGYTPAELAGKDNFEYMYEEDRKKAEAIFEKAIREGTGWKKDLLRWKHKDEDRDRVAFKAAQSSDETGALIGFRGSDRDVTEILAAQDTLQRAYSELEIKVQERTRELARTNEELRMEITERRRAVEMIGKSKELSDTLNQLDAVIHSTLDIGEILQRVVAQVSQETSDRTPQDRQVVYPGQFKGPRRPSHHRRGNVDGAQNGNKDRCRGRRNRGAARIPAFVGLRRSTGLSLQRPPAGGGVR